MTVFRTSIKLNSLLARGALLRAAVLGIFGCLGVLQWQSANAQSGSVITDCALASNGADFISLFGNGLCLNGFDSPRGWVLIDAADQTTTVADPPGPFFLPIINFSGDLEFRAEAQTIGPQEPDKFYVVSLAMANLPPFQRPTPPHPEVIGPFFYGTVENPEFVSFDSTDLDQILGFQDSGSADGRVVILQHEAGNSFKSPGVERFVGVRFAPAQARDIKINELCPQESAAGQKIIASHLNAKGVGTEQARLELVGPPDMDQSGVKVQVLDNNGDQIDLVDLNGQSTNAAGILVIEITGITASQPFGITIFDDAGQLDSATFSPQDRPASDILSSILFDSGESAAELGITQDAVLGQSTFWINREKIPFANSGWTIGKESCGAANPYYAINEVDVFPIPNLDQQIEIATNQNDLVGLVLVLQDDRQIVFGSLDLDEVPVSEGYAEVNLPNAFLPQVAETISLLLFRNDEAYAVGTSLVGISKLPVSFALIQNPLGINPFEPMTEGTEFEYGHPSRDTAQACPDRKTNPILPDPLDEFEIFPATPGSVNTCDFGARAARSTDANTAGAKPTQDPVSAATGEFYTGPIMDISLGGPLPLRFVRRYAAFLADDGRVNSSLGPNWVHDFELQLTMPDSESIEIVYFGGQVLTFRLDAMSGEWTLTDPLRVPFQLKLAGSVFHLMDPARNRVFTFAASPAPEVFGRLLSIQDRNHNVLDLSYLPGASRILDSVTDGLGRTLTFSYTNASLTQVSDGVRILEFDYANGTLIRYTDALGKVTSYQYDNSTGHGPLLTAIGKPEGNQPFTQIYGEDGTVTQQRDEYGSPADIELGTPMPGLTTVTDVEGSMIFAHEPVRHAPTGIQDRDGRPVIFAYDAASRLTTLVDRNVGPDQGITLLSHHDASGKVASYTDAEGNTTVFSYQLREQEFGTGNEAATFSFFDQTHIEFADGSNTQYSYDDSGNVLSVQDPLGASTLFTYNSQGLPTSVTNPTNGTVDQTFNADGTIATQAVGATGSIQFEYDAQKRLNRITFPQGDDPTAPQINVTYDANNRITALTDAKGNPSNFGFDGNGNLRSIDDRDGASTSIEFDLMDQVSAVTNRLNQIRERRYDAIRRLAATTDADGIETTFGYNVQDDVTAVGIGQSTFQVSYDNEGIPTSTTSPLGNTSQLTTDRMGRITQIQNPLGNTTQFGYDERGRLTLIQSADNLRRGYAYNGNSALISVRKLAANGSMVGDVGFEYTANNQLASITDLNGQPWVFAYTDQGRLSSQTDPRNNSASVEHDVRGRVSGNEYPDGTARTLAYDANSNITQLSHSDGPTIVFDYDNQDRLISTGQLAITYDAEGSVIETSSNNVAFGASYTPGQRIESVSYNNSQFIVTYVYDGVSGLLEQVSDSLTGTSLQFFYDLDRRLIRIDRSNNTQAHFEYDPANRLTRIRGRRVSTSEDYMDLRYALNAVGDVVSLTATTPLSSDQSLFSEQTEDYSVDAASQLSSGGFAFDARGRRTLSSGETLVWDGASRLLELGDHRFSYNGLGDPLTHRQITTSRWHYNSALGGRPMVAEQLDGGAFQRFYVYTPAGQLLYLIDAVANNAVHHFDFNRVGSTLVLTDDNGEVSNAYAYLPFGQQLAQTGNSPQPFTFNGRIGVRRIGDNGRYYQMRARVYDARTAGFLTREPLWPLIDNPDLLNPYQFAYQNPGSFVDPSGLGPESADEISTLLEKVMQPFADVGLSGLEEAPGRREISALRLPEARAEFSTTSAFVSTALSSAPTVVLASATGPIVSQGVNSSRNDGLALSLPAIIPTSIPQGPGPLLDDTGFPDGHRLLADLVDLTVRTLLGRISSAPSQQMPTSERESVERHARACWGDCLRVFCPLSTLPAQPPKPAVGPDKPNDSGDPYDPEELLDNECLL